MKTPKGYVSLLRLARMMGVPWPTCYRWERENRLPVVTRSSCKCVTLADAQELALYWRSSYALGEAREKKLHMSETTMRKYRKRGKLVVAESRFNLGFERLTKSSVNALVEERKDVRARRRKAKRFKAELRRRAKKLVRELTRQSNEQARAECVQRQDERELARQNRATSKATRLPAMSREEELRRYPNINRWEKALSKKKVPELNRGPKYRDEDDDGDHKVVELDDDIGVQEFGNGFGHDDFRSHLGFRRRHSDEE